MIILTVTLLVTILALYLWVSIVATRFVVSAENDFERSQTIKQIAIVWLVPFLGAALAIRMLAEAKPMPARHIPWILGAILSVFAVSYGSAVAEVQQSEASDPGDVENQSVQENPGE